MHHFFSNTFFVLFVLDHPGVAAHRLGKPVTMIYYKGEYTKIAGLAEVVATTTTEEIQKLNAEAFRALQETLVMLKMKNHERVVNSSFW